MRTHVIFTGLVTHDFHAPSPSVPFALLTLTTGSAGEKVEPRVVTRKRVKLAIRGMVSSAGRLNGDVRCLAHGGGLASWTLQTGLCSLNILV